MRKSEGAESYLTRASLVRQQRATSACSGGGSGRSLLSRERFYATIMDGVYTPPVERYSSRAPLNVHVHVRAEEAGKQTEGRCIGARARVTLLVQRKLVNSASRVLF